MRYERPTVTVEPRAEGGWRVVVTTSGPPASAFRRGGVAYAIAGQTAVEVRAANRNKEEPDK